MRYILITLFLFTIYSCGSDSSTNVPSETIGCMNPEACNYNPDATSEGAGASGCWFANEGCTCDNDQGSVTDCFNDCEGIASIDNCGVCAGGNTGIQPGSTCGIIQDGCNLPLNTIGFVPKVGDQIYGRIIYNIDPTDIIGISGFQFDINNAGTSQI